MAWYNIYNIWKNWRCIISCFFNSLVLSLESSCKIWFFFRPTPMFKNSIGVYCMKKTFSKSGLEPIHTLAHHCSIELLIPIQTNDIPMIPHVSNLTMTLLQKEINQLWVRSNVLNAQIWLVEVQKMSLSAKFNFTWILQS